MSWPYRPGFLDNPIPIDIPPTNAERLAFLKLLAASWTEPFHSIVQDIPDEAEARAIRVEDWVPKQGVQGNGRVTMMGDAAHLMTMCMLDNALRLTMTRIRLIDINSPRRRRQSRNPRRFKLSPPSSSLCPKGCQSFLFRFSL